MSARKTPPSDTITSDTITGDGSGMALPEGMAAREWFPPIIPGASTAAVHRGESLVPRETSDGPVGSDAPSPREGGNGAGGPTGMPNNGPTGCTGGRYIDGKWASACCGPDGCVQGVVPKPEGAY